MTISKAFGVLNDSTSSQVTPFLAAAMQVLQSHGRWLRQKGRAQSSPSLDQTTAVCDAQSLVHNLYAAKRSAPFRQNVCETNVGCLREWSPVAEFEQCWRLFYNGTEAFADGCNAESKVCGREIA